MTYLALAYGLIWLAVFGYVAMLGRRLSRLNAELEDLRRRVGAALAPAPHPRPGSTPPHP